MMLVQALALILVCVVVGDVDSFTIGCGSMDIANPPNNPKTADFPGQVTCVRRSNGDIWFDVYPRKPFKGLMMQVHRRNGAAVGVFRTARGGNSNPNAVGDDYLVGCPDDIAQYSSDQTEKTEAQGTWTSVNTDDNVDNNQLDCVLTVIESSTMRYVKIKVPAVRGDQRPKRPDFSREKPTTRVQNPTPQRSPTSKPAPSPNPRPAPRRAPPTAQRAQPPRPAPRPTRRPAPRPAPKPVSRSRGRVTIDGDSFLDHCSESSRLRIPVPNSDCLSYYTAETHGGRSRIRAYQSCGSFSMCMSTSTCSCRPCSSFTCSAGSSTRQKVSIYDRSNSETGSVDNKRETGSAGLNKSLNVQGSVNPDNIPPVSSQGKPPQSSSSSSSTLAVLLSAIGGV